MALTRDQKAEQLTDLKEKLQKSTSVMFAHYIGLTVSDVTNLRSKLKEKGAEMKVGKKTLLRIAAKELNMPEVSEEQMDGPVAFIFSYEDPISGAQVTHAYAKEKSQVEIIGGIFEGKVLSKAEAQMFASLPGRTVLLGMFAGMIRSPLVSFASAISSPLTSFARASSELAKSGKLKSE